MTSTPRAAHRTNPLTPDPVNTMNTPTANLNPVSAPQSQNAKGKSQESASDSPFSQVLSTEMAQNRPSGRTDANDKSALRQDEATAQAGSPVLKTDSADTPEDAVLAAAYDALRAAADQTTLDPAAALAIPLGLAPAPLQGPAARGGQDAPDALASTEDGQSRQDSQKGPLTRALQAAQTELAARTVKPDTEKSAPSVAGFAGQLAAAQQSEAPKNGDQLSGLIASSALTTPTQAAAESTPVHTTHLSSRLAPSVGTTAWGQALGEKIVWMAAGAQQTASLTLNPPNLGPLQVVLNISNEQATASFFSAQPEVRQALEAAFPRLREMMSEAGIQLGQASVSADTPRQQTFDTPQQRTLPAFGMAAEAGAPDPGVVQLIAPRMGRGLVDTFA